MEMIPVESSNIAAIGYEPGAEGLGTLAIAFHNGTTYHYAGVPLEASMSLQASASKGRFLHIHIIPHYAATRVPLPEPPQPQPLPRRPDTPAGLG